MSDGELPPGSVVRYKKPTVWDNYRWQIIGAASVSLLQAVLIIGLLVQRRRQLRAVSALQESELRFGRMADAAPVLNWAGRTSGGPISIAPG